METMNWADLHPSEIPMEIRMMEREMTGYIKGYQESFKEDYEKAFGWECSDDNGMMILYCAKSMMDHYGIGAGYSLDLMNIPEEKVAEYSEYLAILSKSDLS